MPARPGSWRLLVATRSARFGALALVVATAIFASSVQAGRLYVYCSAMQTVMSHACCTKLHRDSAVRAAIANPCCEPRSTTSLAAFVPGARDLQVSAPPLATATLTAQPFATNARQSHWVRPSLHGPPPRLRVHVLVMVFQV